MRGMRPFAAVLAIGLMAGAATPSGVDLRVAGILYTIRAYHSPQPTQSATDTGYVAHVAYAGQRGRMDIVTGAEGSMFAAGDYVLFDTAQYIIVHPATKTYSTLPDFGAMSSQMADMMKLSDVKMRIDTLESGMVNGMRARHYRTNMSFTMTMDMSSFGVSAAEAPPPMHSSMVGDVWYADSVDNTPNPFMKSADEMPNIPFIKPILDQMKQLRTAMPVHRLAVKMSNAVQIEGMGVNNSNHSTADITDFRHGDVDVTRLVLPPDFTQAAVGGMEMLGPPVPLTPQALAKWRTVPKG